MYPTVSLEVSWWLLALIVGGTAPLWIRALRNKWERRAQRRTERVLAQFDRESEHDQLVETSDGDENQRS